jgi:hypothetical protein
MRAGDLLYGVLGYLYGTGVQGEVCNAEPQLKPGQEHSYPRQFLPETTRATVTHTYLHLPPKAMCFTPHTSHVQLFMLSISKSMPSVTLIADLL